MVKFNISLWKDQDFVLIYLCGFKEKMDIAKFISIYF